MESFEFWQIVALFIGSAGIGGIVTSVVRSTLAVKRAPIETKHLEATLTQALTDASKELVLSQAAVLAGRDAEIGALKARVDDLEANLQRVLSELETERLLREERERELEKHRLEIEKQTARISYLRRRVNAFMKELRNAGIDPESIERELAELEKEDE